MNLEQLHKELTYLVDNTRRNNEILNSVNNKFENVPCHSDSMDKAEGVKHVSSGLLEDLFSAAKQVNSLLDLQWGMLQRTQRYVEGEKIEVENCAGMTAFRV